MKIVIAGLADGGQRRRCRQRREQRVRRRDRRVGRKIDSSRRRAGHRVTDVHVVGIDRQAAAHGNGGLGRDQIFDQIRLQRRSHRDLHRVVGVVGLVALGQLIVVIGNAANVVGAGCQIAGQRHTDRLLIVVTGQTDGGQRRRCRQRREQRVRRRDRRVGRNIDCSRRGACHGVADIHVVGIDRQAAPGGNGRLVHGYIFDQVRMARRRHGNLDRIVGVVGLVALAELVVVVADTTDVVGARRHIAGERDDDRLMVVIAGLTYRREGHRGRHRRKQRIRCGDCRVGGEIDARDGRPCHCVTEIHVVGIDRHITSGRYGALADSYEFGQVGLGRPHQDGACHHAIGELERFDAGHRVGAVGRTGALINHGKGLRDRTVGYRVIRPVARIHRHIGTGAANNGVVAAAASDRIVAGAAVQHVGDGVADDRIVAGAAGGIIDVGARVVVVEIGVVDVA